MMTDYLKSGRFIDSGTPQVNAYAQDITGAAGSDVEHILLLYRAVRDGIVYDPYVDVSDPENFRASTVLTRGRGFCIGKAALFAAGARALGIPARVGYADVRNHLTSPRFYDYMKTDIFIWHSYADVHVAGRWVKATPAFDIALCERLNLKPLEFDAQADSLLHPFDRAGRRHMEYLKDRGTFADVPFEAIQADFRIAYPMLMQEKGLAGDFRAEATAGTDD
jgi:transglutaminase-like putative cysteine protease